ncbi:MAG: hypothetical protein AVDCRST_MAG29-1869, partial [uncultured Nocardioidaceae bacterium]
APPSPDPVPAHGAVEAPVRTSAGQRLHAVGLQPAASVGLPPDSPAWRVTAGHL